MLGLCVSVCVFWACCVRWLRVVHLWAACGACMGCVWCVCVACCAGMGCTWCVRELFLACVCVCVCVYVACVCCVGVACEWVAYVVCSS
jgi:hypothetical protein